MIRSMTGFGRGEVVEAGYRYLAEIKSVNHRFLNVNLRLPREFSHLESELVAQCGARCGRGHLNVRIEVEAEGSEDVTGPRLNRPVLERYLKLIDTIEGLEGSWSVTDGVSLDALLSLPGVVEWDPEPVEIDAREFGRGAGRALEEALNGMMESREIEGRALESDFRDRLTRIEECRKLIVERAPDREDRERERLRLKVSELLEERGDVDLDQRIAQEIVILADRVDVSEELTRMQAHVDHFRAELEGEAGTVGRKLTFILQELNREANTIGAKANEPEIQQAAIEIKTELEKMREQAENVE